MVRAFLSSSLVPVPQAMQRSASYLLMLLVHSWIFCNLMQAFCGWLYGQFPPGLLANFKLAGAHLLNMFRAHTAAYNAIKELPGEHFLLT